MCMNQRYRGAGATEAAMQELWIQKQRCRNYGYRSSDVETMDKETMDKETMDTETMDKEAMDTETGFVGSRDGKNRNGEYRNGKRAENIVLFRRGKESDTVSTA